MTERIVRTVTAADGREQALEQLGRGERVQPASLAVQADTGLATAPVHVAPSDYPAIFAAADRAALDARNHHVHFVQADLALVVSAAAVAGIHAFVPEPFARLAGGAAAILLLATLVIHMARSMLRYQDTWYGSRTAAESVKSAAWRYMMRVRPFHDEDLEADKRFIAILKQILASQASLQLSLRGMPSRAAQITPGMRRVRSLPLPERKQCYHQERVFDQIAYYAGKAEKNARSGAIWFWAGSTARGAALAFAVLAATTPGMVAIVGVFSAVATAVTAWGEVGRHEELSQRYTRTAQELMLIETLLDDAHDEPAFDRCVADVESIMSSEYAAWASNRS
ncbi:MAG TPA: DUF4231 domain-containing protein [Chloroflexota bacterium]|nr:DUF4231 domain-containing protein [Chloroflexota bacterium]